MSISLKIHDAIIFATLKQQNQKRKGTEIPYIVLNSDLPKEIESSVSVWH